MQRGRVLRLSRLRLRLLIAALVAWAALVGFGLVVAPWVLSDLRGYRKYADLTAQRALLGERLRALAQRLQGLQSRADELRFKVGKIHLAYGLGLVEAARTPAAEASPVGDSIYDDMLRSLEALRQGTAAELVALDRGIERSSAFEREHADAAVATPAACPLRSDDFVLTSGFGTRRSTFTREIEFHSGVDFAARPGSPVVAPAAGVVVYAGKLPVRETDAWWRLGNLVVLRHGGSLLTLFGHLGDLRVRAGQRLRQGEVLGTVGNSGWSASPHLHYEVRRLADGRWVPADPRVYILDRSWKDADQMLARAATGAVPEGYLVLPAFLAR